MTKIESLTIERFVGNNMLFIIPNENYVPRSALQDAKGTLAIHFNSEHLGDFSIDFCFKFLEEFDILDLSNKDSRNVIKGLIKTLAQRKR